MIQDNVTGSLFRPKDTGDCIEKTSRLVSQPAVRHTLAQRALARARMQSWGSVLSVLMEGYYAIISSRTNHPPARRRKAA